MTKDSLGTRMKQYEDATRYKLLRRSYTVIRVDGKAFHTYTRGLEKPFDEDFIQDMNATAIELCHEIQGAKFAFVQSDEISVLITDFDNLETESWYDNTLQKMCSVSASIATQEFNQRRNQRFHDWWNSIRDEDEYDQTEFSRLSHLYGKRAFFDSRVFQLPTKTEVENYFIWRQQDTVRNSIQSVAQSLYSQKELNGKNGNDLQEMIFQKGINWNDYPVGQKRGRFICQMTEDSGNWSVMEPPIFTQERTFLSEIIPENN